MTTYISLRTANETVVIKNPEPVLVVEPASGKLSHGGYSEEVKVQFVNYKLATEDEAIIKYMDNPKYGFGSGWIKAEVDKTNAGDQKDAKPKK